MLLVIAYICAILRDCQSSKLILLNVISGKWIGSSIEGLYSKSDTIENL